MMNGVTTIEAALRRFFARHGIEPCRIVAAVSGGTDSTSLLLALAGLRDDGFLVEAAHVNHHLRGAESDADEAFVRELSRELGMALHVLDGTLDPERIRARGIEAAAREVRYALLSDVRLERDARFVATAHQKNDQAETVLMRLLTGTGLSGLRGIHPLREDGYVRPLLDVTREELEAFLRERDVTARHDRSNDDPRFLRNRVRVMVRDLRSVDSLAAIAAQAREQWPILERAVDDAERTCVVATGDETRFVSWPADAWLRQALLHRHIRRLDRRRDRRLDDAARDVSARDLARLAASVDDLRRVSVTKTLELIRRDGTVVLRHRPEGVAAFEVELSPEAPAWIEALGRGVHVARATTTHPPSTTRERATFQLPSHALPHFTLRNRRPGDRFQPLGMPNPKKLKDFLIGRKIPVEIRDRLPLLLWNDEIVWVAGVEISERFRITGAEADRYEAWLYA
jgi:tRNA(Ile)-lysidine synthase